MLLCSPHVFRKGLDSKPQLKRNELRRRQNVGVLGHKENERSSERGFTMAELLVVVAIIAVLVAIAIPVFSSQLRNSRLAVDHAAMRDAYALMQMANNTQEVEIGGRVYSFDELRADSESGVYQLKNFYLTDDCSSFVFPVAGSISVPQGAYQFKETGCEAESPHECETCLQFNGWAGYRHYKGEGIALSFDGTSNCITFS